jgi:hypothetical protein
MHLQHAALHRQFGSILNKEYHQGDLCEPSVSSQIERSIQTRCETENIPRRAPCQHASGSLRRHWQSWHRSSLWKRRGLLARCCCRCSDRADSRVCVAVAVNDMPHGAQHDTSCGAQDSRAPRGRGVSRAGTGSAACLADAAAATRIEQTRAFA